MGGGYEAPLEHGLHDANNSSKHPDVKSQGQSNDTIGLLVNMLFPLRILTHNIRYAATSLFPHEHPWPDRLPNILRQLHHYTSTPFNPPSTIICLQEVLHSQLQDIRLGLGSDWQYVGVGRDDGRDAGEYNPIFYRKNYWEKSHSDTVWLSETPDKPGLGWDAGCNRICECLVLWSKESKRKVVVLNTHLDNAGPIARQEGAKLILKYTRKWKEQFKADSVVLTGDLNSTKDEEDGAWQVLNGNGSSFVDVRRLLAPREDVRQFGDEVTFTGFDGNGDEDEVGTLDFVHLVLGEDESLEQARSKLHAYSVIPNLFEDGVRCSDHRAVVVDMLL